MCRTKKNILLLGRGGFIAVQADDIDHSLHRAQRQRSVPNSYPFRQRRDVDTGLVDARVDVVAPSPGRAYEVPLEEILDAPPAPKARPAGTPTPF